MPPLNRCRYRQPDALTKKTLPATTLLVLLADQAQERNFCASATFFCRVGKGASKCHAWDNSDHRSDFIADRRAADVAIQRRLGILPRRWTRPDPHYCPCPRSRRPIVTSGPLPWGCRRFAHKTSLVRGPFHLFKSCASYKVHVTRPEQRCGDHTRNIDPIIWA